METDFDRRNTRDKDPTLALTLGDPAGIGPEIAARTLATTSFNVEARGVAVGDLHALRRAVEVCRLDVDVRQVADFDVPVGGDGVIYILDTGVLGNRLPEWGKVDARAGRAAVTAIEVATRAALNGDVSAIVTAPINKEAIWAAGSQHLGHTEMLGELTGVTRHDTMFVVRKTAVADHQLKIFFTTRHMALRKAIDGIDRESVRRSIHEAVLALKVFGVAEPRLAVAALKPHGGENGAFGDDTPPRPEGKWGHRCRRPRPGRL